MSEIRDDIKLKPLAEELGFTVDIYYPTGAPNPYAK